MTQCTADLRAVQDDVFRSSTVEIHFTTSMNSAFIDNFQFLKK